MTQSSPCSLPAAAPHYAPPPYVYRDCPVRIVPFRTAPGVTRRLTPEPLEPAAGDVMFVAVGRMNNDTLGSTQEAFCVVPARFGSQLGELLRLSVPGERRMHYLRTRDLGLAQEAGPL